jgi:CBS-domain-containing membrane protein
MLLEGVLSVARERLVTIGDSAPVFQAAKFLGSPTSNLLIVCDTIGAMAGVMSKADIVTRLDRPYVNR